MEGLMVHTSEICPFPPSFELFWQLTGQFGLPVDTTTGV